MALPTLSSPSRWLVNSRAFIILRPWRPQMRTRLKQAAMLVSIIALSPWTTVSGYEALRALPNALQDEVTLLCLPTQHAEGAAAYRACVYEQTELRQSLASTELAGLSFNDRFAVLRSCESGDAGGISAICVDEAIAELRSVPSPTLSTLPEDERYVLDRQCYPTQLNANAADYRRCLNDELLRLETIETPSLASLARNEQTSVKLDCSSQNDTVFNYRSCLANATGIPLTIVAGDTASAAETNSTDTASPTADVSAEASTATDATSDSAIELTDNATSTAAVPQPQTTADPTPTVANEAEVPDSATSQETERAATDDLAPVTPEAPEAAADTPSDVSTETTSDTDATVDTPTATAAEQPAPEQPAPDDTSETSITSIEQTAAPATGSMATLPPFLQRVLNALPSSVAEPVAQLLGQILQIDSRLLAIAAALLLLPLLWLFRRSGDTTENLDDAPAIGLPMEDRRTARESLRSSLDGYEDDRIDDAASAFDESQVDELRDYGDLSDVQGLEDLDTPDKLDIETEFELPQTSAQVTEPQDTLDELGNDDVTVLRGGPLPAVSRPDLANLLGPDDTQDDDAPTRLVQRQPLPGAGADHRSEALGNIDWQDDEPTRLLFNELDSENKAEAPPMRSGFGVWLLQQPAGTRQQCAIEFLIYWIAYADERYHPDLRKRLFVETNLDVHDTIKRWALKQDSLAFADTLGWLCTQCSDQQRLEILDLVMGLLIYEQAISPAQCTLLRFLGDLMGGGKVVTEQRFKQNFGHSLPSMPRADKDAWWETQNARLIARWDHRALLNSTEEERAAARLGVLDARDHTAIHAAYQRAIARCEASRFQHLGPREQAMVDSQRMRFENDRNTILGMIV